MAFDAMTTKHTFANALAMAECSQLVYQDPANIRSGIEAAIGIKLRKNEFKFLDHKFTHAQGFMAGLENAIVLCFRGTESLADWILDGQIAQVPYRDIGRVHLGFQLAYNSVHDEVEATLQQWSGQGRTLWITGHSLGGAMALIAAANLRFPIDPIKAEPRPIAGVYTFGQPRVGSGGFCQACEVQFGSVYFRYVNNEDIVTRVPPRLKFYDDAGSIKYIDRNQEIHEDPGPMQMFIDRIRAGLELLQRLQLEKPKIGAIADHAIADYIAAIKKKLGS